MQPLDWQTEHGPEQIEVFEYPAAEDGPPLDLWADGAGGRGDAPAERDSQEAPKAPDSPVHAEYEHRLMEETRRSFEAGRERGRQEGQREERELQKTMVAAGDAERVRQAVALVERFTQERDRFLETVEREVVELALAVAARILRREAQMDPLLLTGAVRVALGQLSGSTEVRLRIPPAEMDLWGEAIAHLPNLAIKPVLVAEEGMQRGDCSLETSLGSVDLGIQAQLAEIERGFFDRAGAQRAAPGGEAKPAAQTHEERSL